MLHAPQQLGRTRRVHAPQGDLPLQPNDLASAYRARRRHRKNLLAAGPLLRHRRLDGRNHVPGLHQPHMVAYADILACHLIGVVQRRAGDCRAGQLHGLELRDRRQDARAAHLHRYALNDGLRPLRRILVRARPARTVRRRAKRVVEPPLVQLHHGAVDLEPERVAQRLQLIDRGEHLLHRGAGLRPGRHGEAPAAKRRDHLRMRREAVAANAAGVVDHDV